MGNGPILVTGSGGFVASHLLPLLPSVFAGSPVVKVVRRPPAPEGGFAVDLADGDATFDLVRRVQPRLVFHLAAESSPAVGRQNPSAVWRSNRDASYRLARAIARHAPEATVLYASSGEVYGRSLAAGPADETTPTRPVGPYGASKRGAEAAFLAALPPSSRLIVTRAFNHTGPGQSESFVVPAFAAQIARIEAGLAPPRILVGNLAPERDFLDVRDVADAYVRLAAAAASLPPRAIVNVARGKTFSIRYLLDTLIALSGIAVSVEVDPRRYRPADVPVATARTGVLSSIMPWPPARPLEDTLRDVLDHQRAIVGAHGRATDRPGAGGPGG